MSDIDPSKLEIVKATFEVRYDPAFMLWDRAGSIWSAVKKKYPTTTVMKSSPMEIVCSINNRFELNVSLEKLFAIDFVPEPDLEKFIPLAETFLGSTEEHLGLSDYTRIGARFFYKKRFPSKDAAAAAVLSTKQVHGPTTSSSKLFNIDGAIVEPAYGLRWEGEKAGVLVQVNAATQKLELSVPKDFQRDIEPTDQQFFEVNLDIDYYVKALTPSTLLKTGDWIRQAAHIVRRDAKYLLGGV